MTKSKQQPPTTVIENCSIVAEANTQTIDACRAIEKLAEASAKHAEALAEAAKSLKGIAAHIETGIYISQGK